MIRNKFLNYIALVVVACLSLTSCIKDDITDTTNHGSTFLKFLEAPENKIFFEPFTDIRTVNLFSLRKDPNSNAKLNEAVLVKMAPKPELIDTFNVHNNSDFEVLPDSLYTLDPGNPFVNGTWQINMAPGEFARDFTIKLNGAKWDLAHKYALGFTISEVGSDKASTEKKDIVVLISIKNKWDGVYSISGTVQDVTNAAFTGIYNDPGGYNVKVEYGLETLSATECIVVDYNYTGIPALPFWAGTGWSYYGSFGLIVEFDPVTDKVVKVTNYYGQGASANKRSAKLDPSGINAYDATTKTVNIKYNMVQEANLNPAPPNNVRTIVTEEWKFKGPR